VDGFHGVTVRDQKLTESLDVEGRYIDSMQWRAYLAMLGAKQFIYDVFVGKVVPEEQTVLVREYHKLTFYAYPEIQADVTRAVCELAEVVARHQAQIAALKQQEEKCNS
jgi:predicted ester cyclase